MTVGSHCSAMPICSRFAYTAATIGRSSGSRRFLLDHRGERDQLPDRQTPRRRPPRAAPASAPARTDRPSRGRARDASVLPRQRVGVRKQIALEIPRGGIERPDRRGVARRARRTSAPARTPAPRRSAAISAIVSPSGKVTLRRSTSPRAILPMTSSAVIGRSNRYSPACSRARSPLSQAPARKVSASRTTPAPTRRSPIARVPAPGGISTNCSGPA